MGLTPQELDKALEKGQVSLQDFQRFAEAIFKRYGENAKAIAAGPQSAGDRLKVQLQKLSESVGTLLKPIGAFFQETFGGIVRDITRATNALARFLNLSFDEGKLAAAEARFEAANAVIESPTATRQQKQRAIGARERASKVIRAQTRLRDAGIEVEQPAAGTGLPGITDDSTIAQATAAKSLADQQQETYNRILAQITKRNALNAEDDKFERERIKIRIQAAKDIEAIDKGVAESRKRELFDLIERGRMDALRKVDLEEQKALLEQMLELEVDPQPTKLQAFVNEGRKSLEDLQQVAINVSQGIGNAVGSALTNGISSLIEGTQSAKQVFANFLKSVGQMLVQEGARMIATYIAIGVARAFAGLASASSPTPPQTLPGGSVQTGGGLNINGVDQGINPVGFAANGGPVNAGRPYMVGERGPELFVPGSNGGIMRNEEMRRLMGRSPAGASGGAAAMNFTFETTNIGGTEYVSREQLESAMATTRRQAANDGARRGMSMTLDKMQNSPRTRSRIGIS